MIRTPIPILAAILLATPAFAIGPDDAYVKKSGDGALDAQAAFEALTVHPDLKLQLFAAEPMLTNPSHMDIDHRGRVWVSEIVNYRKNHRPEGDRIVILEDTDGDGKADSSKVFYQGKDIDSPHGICVLPDPDGVGQQVIVSVSATGSIVRLIDDDGDDKPEKQEVLFSGISGTQHDHGIHGVQFGPDGRLYFNMGNNGVQLKDKDGNIVVDKAGNAVDERQFNYAEGRPYQQGLVFRCELDGSHVDTIGWNFRNNWLCAVDSFGTVWQSDNDDDGNRGVRINYVMEFGNYGYKDAVTRAGWREKRTNLESDTWLQHWHLNDPGVVPNVLQTYAGSPTGITVYEGDLLPAIFQNQVIHCDAGPNVVRAYPVAIDGAGYAAEVVNLIKGERDRWFRPSHVATAPDGSLFVADWYDAGVGGHGMADKERGRVYRLVPKTHDGRYKVTNGDMGSPKGLVNALRSPNYAMRSIAYRALKDLGELGDPEWGQAKAFLMQLVYDKNPRIAARAIWLLADIWSEQLGEYELGSPKTHTGKPDEAGTVFAFLRHANPDLRITALRAIRCHAPDRVVEAVRQLLDDDVPPSVLREAALALRFEDSKEADQLWAKLATRHDGEDRWYLEALGIGSDLHASSRFEAWRANAGDGWNTPAGRDIIWRSRAPEALDYLVKIIAEGMVPEAEIPRFIRALDFHFGPQKEAALKRLAAAGGEGYLLEVVSRLGVGAIDPAIGKQVDKILGEHEGTSQFVEIVGQFKLRHRAGDLLTVALAKPASNDGVAAASILLGWNGLKDFMPLLEGEDEEKRGAAFGVLGRTQSRDAINSLSRMAANGKVDETRRLLAVGALGSSTQGQKWLLANYGKLPEKIAERAAVSLRFSADPRIRKDAKKVIGGNASTRPLDKLLRMKGNARKGEAAFTKATCITCHQIGDAGVSFGPALSDIGNKLSRDALFTAILEPDAGIEHNYQGWTIELKDGTPLIGFIVSETKETTTLRIPGGLDYPIANKQIKSREKLPNSLMPKGLDAILSDAELADLVAFLQAQKLK